MKYNKFICIFIFIFNLKYSASTCIRCTKEVYFTTAFIEDDQYNNIFCIDKVTDLFTTRCTNYCYAEIVLRYPSNHTLKNKYDFKLDKV